MNTDIERWPWVVEPSQKPSLWQRFKSLFD